MARGPPAISCRATDERTLLAQSPTDPDGPRLASRAFEGATRVVLHWPWATLVVALALAAASLALACTRLGYRTNRLDLLNPTSDYNRLWIDYIEEFGDE